MRGSTLKRLSADKRAAVIAELTAHPNAKAVTEKVGGVSTTSVWTIAKREGIKLAAGMAAQGHHRTSPEKRAEIVAALNVSHNAAQVAREFGLSPVGVWKIAKNEGIVLTGGDRQKRAEIVAALNAVHNAAQVARELGLNASSVWKIAVAEGIELARSGADQVARRRKEADQHLVGRRLAQNQDFAA